MNRAKRVEIPESYSRDRDNNVTDRSTAARRFSSYVPAELKAGKDWLIEYYVPDPENSFKLKRKRVRVKPISNLKARKKLAREMVANLNQLLASGWNPLIHADARRALTPMDQVFSDYMRYKRDLAADSKRANRSFINMLTQFMIEKHERILKVCDWNKSVAINYLKWIRFDRSNSVRTHNNHLNFCKGLWSWMVRMDLAFESPFSDIKLEKVRKKRRVVIPDDKRQEIFTFFREKDFPMYLSCLLVFAAGLRRTEICRLRIGDIDTSNGIIFLDASDTKMGESRSPTIPGYLMSAINTYLNGDEPSSFYLIGHEWKPSSSQILPNRLSDKWSYMRKRLNLPSEFQLYSLRDGGIQHLYEKGLDSQTIMHQFGHKDLTTTTKYSIRVNPKTVERIRKDTIEVKKSVKYI